MDTRSIKRNYRIQQWKAIIKDRNNTNPTVDEYCKQNGLSRHFYFYWLRIIKEEALKQPSATGFVELSLQADNGSEVSMVTPISVEKLAPSQLTLSVNGMIMVTENTSSAGEKRTVSRPCFLKETGGCCVTRDSQAMDVSSGPELSSKQNNCRLSSSAGRWNDYQLNRKNVSVKSPRLSLKAFLVHT